MATVSADQEVAVADEPARKAPAKKAAAKKATAKKAPAKKTAAKKTAAKKTAAKKTPAKKTAAREAIVAAVPVARPEPVLAPPRPAPEASGPLADARTLGRLVGAYRDGTYRAVPRRKLALVGVGLAYVASPLDVVPDFVPLGFLDDLLVLGLVLKAVKSEVDAFSRWEQAKG